MADISKITLPDGETYNLKNSDAARANAAATETAYGVIKLNPNESVTLNNDGQLKIGGRLGQMTSTNGIYAPNSISPNAIGNGSLLLTEASGTTLGTKSLAVSTGTNLTVSSAAAGSTTYYVKNTYVNRIICAGLVGGRATRNEASASTTVAITSVTINGSSYTPDSGADSSDMIVIKCDGSANPTTSVTQIRVYPPESGFSNLYVGQSVGGDTSGNPGASVIVGQKIFTKSGNACALIGADMYNTGNGNACFGRQHISRKNRSFLAGTGHDTTNAKNESVAAFGEFSRIDSSTAFAVGGGANATSRSNLFEVTTDGGVVLKSPNGTRFKITIDDSGNLTTSALT